MLTLTPVVCMLSAIAFSNVFERYLGDDMKRENPPIEDSSDEDDKRNPGNLYDKVSRGSKRYRSENSTLPPPPPPPEYFKCHQRSESLAFKFRTSIDVLQ